MVRDNNGQIVKQGKYAGLHKNVQSVVEPYMFSYVISPEAHTSYCLLYEAFKNHGYYILIENTLQIRLLVYKPASKNDKIGSARLSERTSIARL